MAADVDDISVGVEYDRRRRVYLQQDLIGRRLQHIDGSRQQFRQDCLRQTLPGLGIAEEAGDADQ
ncbi:MAG: hypothetical protein LC667_12470 [Thioalkalivibrio sp.]|nr:hypothetical protein [Thioalkalivibrio sp.]